MGDILKAIKLIPETILQWHVKQIEEQNLLERCNKVIESFDTLKAQAENRDREVKKAIEAMHEDISNITFVLGATKEGVKKELGETLHQWHELGVKRGWMSKAEKDEITEIYNIYCKKLNGNGIGEFYYNDLIKLPESSPG